MPDVPAICSDCGAIFGAGLSSAIIKNTQFGGTKVGPCPECGGTGIIPDGIYSFVGDVVEVIATSVQGAKDIREIILRLSNIASRNLEPDQFRDAISKEVPELKKFSDIMPRTRTELYAFVAILLTALGMLAGTGVWLGSQTETIDKTKIEQIVDDAIAERLRENHRSTDNSPPIGL
ncbi:MAG: hypothetical protein WC216_06465 [Gallionella sp.]